MTNEVDKQGRDVNACKCLKERNVEYFRLRDIYIYMVKFKSFIKNVHVYKSVNIFFQGNQYDHNMV